jgi:hypothetical protein
MAAVPVSPYLSRRIRKNTGPISRTAMTKQKPLKPKKKMQVGIRQNFDAEKAKRNALAQFDVGLNNYQRGSDNRWRKVQRP